MVEQRPSGWYDDPSSDDNLRYWDGVMWTEHVASKRPHYEQGHYDQAHHEQGHQQGTINEPAAGASAEQWAAYQAQQARAGSYGVQDRRRGGYAQAGAAGGDVQLSGWWRRVGALIVDTLLVGIITLPITFSRILSVSDSLNAWFDEAMAAAETGASVTPQFSEQLLGDVAFVGFVQTFAYIALEVWLLSRSGVTPGRRLTGIRVRPVGVDAPVPVSLGLRRTIVKMISNLLSSVPLLSSISSIFQMVDYLWPLADKGKQALHDKVATTQVVRGKPLRVGHDASQHGAGDQGPYRG